MNKNKGIIGIGLIVAIVLGIVVVGGGAYYLGTREPSRYDGNWNEWQKQEVKKDETTIGNDSILFEKNWKGLMPTPNSAISEGKTQLYNSGRFVLEQGKTYEGQISKERVNNFIKKIKDTGILSEKECLKKGNITDYSKIFKFVVNGKEYTYDNSVCNIMLDEIEKELNININNL